MNKKIKKFVIYKNKTIRDALNVIDKNGQKTCFVLDKNQKLLGSITDGDIRRKILKSGTDIKFKSVENYYNKKPIKIFNHNASTKKIKNIFHKKKIEILPVLNSNFKILNVILRSEVFNLNKRKITSLNSLKKISVVVMAGGKGQRLDPITRIFPKPLVPIKDRTAIENIINSFTKFGVKKFYLILNYKADLIKAFFKSKNLFQKILFINEQKPLGTAGGLEKLKNKIKDSFIVTNCDVFFNFNYNDLILHHKKNKNDLSLVVSSETSYLPYGVCEVDKDCKFKKIKEKPVFKHLITTGLYVINPSILKIIPKNKYLGMNTLIDIAKNKNLKIGIFKIGKNNWQDIGQLRDYKKNISLLSV